MSRWPIPEPIPIDWPMRTTRCAVFSQGFLDDGRFRQVISHASLQGVTPAMCLWFLERLDAPLCWRGHIALGYRFWHPRDHIFFGRLGEFGSGDRWHIVEALGADRRFMIDQVFTVTKLDETGFTMEIRRFGHTVLCVDERWEPTDIGLRWTVEMTVGSMQPGLRAISRLMIRRRMAVVERWRRHNVEEVGNLQHILPELWHSR